ncbi:uncharacterized protein LOC126739759 [Anthonomus grandis grandis]|uniref:uncharacterized protein LOC126739759 n=1 Tax=Anthonomus grandis grandis TaxID=2921223 RepID=UPI002166B3F1|nr:uncharacterized protein LOC126739759 [Anthonomus grandis grandis]
MSNVDFENAITVLQQPGSSKKALKALICIRSEVDWPRNKANVVRLRERGCLKQITGILLNSKHKHHIDLALSILGNCLMDRICTSEVVTQYNIMSILNQLLKKHPKEDSINGRVFRIIGNMCQHRDQWSSVLIDKKPYIITHLVEIIKSASKDVADGELKITDATIMTSLRALRELVNGNTVDALVKQFGALKAIGALFIKYSLIWQENKEQEKMLIDIVRVIQEYSKFQLYHSIIEMRNTERGDSLVHLANVLMLAPRRIVKIVMNFIKSCQLQSEIPIPEICAKFIDVLEKHSIVDELHGHYSEYLQCLCYLLDHPANRNQERCGKAVPLLIKVLKDFQQASDKVVQNCILLFNTLNKFKYEDSLMLEQLKHGIVEVIVEKLTWVVGSPEVLNLKHATEKKRKYTFGPCCNNQEPNKRSLLHDNNIQTSVGRPSSPNSSDDDLNSFVVSLTARSPSPMSSSDSESANMSWSDAGSSPQRNVSSGHDSDSDYSPVCSEVDEAEFPLEDITQGSYNSDPLPSIADVDEEEERIAEAEPHTVILSSLKRTLGKEILKLLKSYAKLGPQLQLANEDLLMQLTKCAISEDFNYSNIITHIINSHYYIIPIMKTNYIQSLFAMRQYPQDHDTCFTCNLHQRVSYNILTTFVDIAETGAGKGDIAHQLVKGDTETKEMLVWAIPYLIREGATIRFLMLQCGGLKLLVNLLQKDNAEHQRKSLFGLSLMASNCLIPNPTKTSTNCNKLNITAKTYEVPSGTDQVVTFLFDNGELVDADRDYLMEKSDFFKVLLSGHFKESGQNQVTLACAKADSFRCMLVLLEVDKKVIVGSAIDLELETLLDVILLCDRYLLDELCVSLTECVEKFHIEVDTVPTIYKWSIESGTNLLRGEAVCYALVAPVNEREKYKMFKTLFKLDYREQLAGDIEKIFERCLSMSFYKQRGMDIKKKHVKMRDRLLKKYV